MFNVGDKVYIVGTTTVGVVKSISPKRKDVRVSFGDYEEVFTSDGRDKGVWHSEHIAHLTPSADKNIKKALLLHDIDIILHNIKTADLTYEQIKQVAEILGCKISN